MSQKNQAAFNAMYDQILSDMEVWVTRARHDRETSSDQLQLLPVNRLMHEVMKLHRQLLELHKLGGGTPLDSYDNT